MRMADLEAFALDNRPTVMNGKCCDAACTVIYFPGTGRLEIRCSECGQDIASVLVASSVLPVN